MTYRKFLIAGAASATIGLLGGSVLAQIGQQQQPRPGQAATINGEEFLNQIEGEWNVEVTIYNMDVLERAQQKRAGEPARPGVRPGEPRPGIDPASIPQMQTQIEQAFVRAGVSQQEARTHAQRLVQRIQQERPSQAQMQTMIQQAMAQAGVSQTQAQQEAQRLSQNLRRHVPGDGEPLRPEDDPTAPPIRPDRPDRPGVAPGQPDRPGVTPRGEAQFRGTGTASRSWTLNDTFLQEELTFSVRSEGGADRQPQQQPQLGERRINLRNGDEYEALGLFAFEGRTGDVCMVWADNAKSMLHYNIGQYDTAQQAMVFYTIDPERMTLPQSPARPGITPAPRPAPGGPQDYRETRPGQQDRPGITRAGETQERLRLDPQGSRIVLRIINDNEHVVEVYYDDGFGRATRVMELNYSRNN